MFIESNPTAKTKTRQTHAVHLCKTYEDQLSPCLNLFDLTHLICCHKNVLTLFQLVRQSLKRRAHEPTIAPVLQSNSLFILNLPCPRLHTPLCHKCKQLNSAVSPLHMTDFDAPSDLQPKVAHPLGPLIGCLSTQRAFSELSH